MKKLLRFLSRLFFHGSKLALRPLEAIAPRLFMVMYGALLRIMGVIFTGAPRYIASNAKFDDFDLVSIGRRVVISQHVVLLTHDYSFSTARTASGNEPERDVYFLAPITIEDNVFIGMGAMLLPGTKIGANSVIGARSVVRGSLEGGYVYAGNPAQKLFPIGQYESRLIELSKAGTRTFLSD